MGHAGEIPSGSHSKGLLQPDVAGVSPKLIKKISSIAPIYVSSSALTSGNISFKRKAMDEGAPVASEGHRKRLHIEETVEPIRDPIRIVASPSKKRSRSSDDDRVHELKKLKTTQT